MHTEIKMEYILKWDWNTYSKKIGIHTEIRFEYIQNELTKVWNT